MTKWATIPYDIKYEEKLFGKLTVKQSIYLSILVLLAALVYTTDYFAYYPKIIIVGASALLAVLFVFTDMDQHILNYVRFYTGQRAVSWLSPKIKEFVGVDDIRENSVCMADGRLLGVVKTTPIDFFMLPEEHRDRVISGFRRFLNSLAFPIQIVMRSVTLDVDTYLANLKDVVMKTKDERKITYYKKYAEFLRSIIDTADIADREYYVVVPTPAPGKEEDKLRTLESDCERVIHGLGSAGISARRLDTHELKGLYGNYFAEQYRVDMQYASPVTLYRRMAELAETENEMRENVLKYNNNLPPEAMMREETYSLSPEDVEAESATFRVDDRILTQLIVSPDEISVSNKDVLINKYHRVLVGVNYPRQVDAGWLSNLVAMKADINLSMHVSPYKRKTAVSLLNNQIKKLETDVYTLKSTGKIVPASMSIQLEDMRDLLTHVEAGTEKVFDFGLYIDVKAQDRNTLDALVKKARNIMDSIMIQPKVPSLQMKEAVQSCLPIAVNKLGHAINRTMTSSSAAACFPFVSSSFGEGGGSLLGFNRLNDIPVIIDPFAHPNHNILCLGTSGGGKSFCIKLLAMRQYIAGTDVYIIDPQGEYADMVESLGGDVIVIAPDSESVINPLDMMEMTYDEKKLSLYSFFNVMLGETMSEPMRAVVDECLDKVYEDKGITQDPVTWNQEPPTLEDLYRAIEPKLSDRREMIYMPALAVYNRLKPYVTGPMRFLNKQTTVDLKKRIISFDISRIEEGKGKRAVLYLVLEYIYKKMKQNRKRKMVIVDEAWSVLESMTSQEDDYITKIVRTARKFNLSLCMISQQVNDFMTPIKGTTIPRGESVLANTAIKLLLKQDPSVIRHVADYFNLNEEEKEYLTTASPGDVLFIAQSSKIPVVVVASPEEEVLITTNADELYARSVPKKHVEPEKDFSIAKPIHLRDALTETQVIALEKSGFRKIVDPGLESDRSGDIMLIKNETEESDEHFIVANLIFAELERLREKEGFSKDKMGLRRHLSVMPDINFRTPDRKFIAIEVVDYPDMPKHGIPDNFKDKPDVGKRGDAFLEKIRTQKHGYDEWFIVVARQDLKEHFESYGKVLYRTEVANRLKKLFEK